MAGQQADVRTDGRETTGRTLKRRGLMAAAAALVVGIAAKQTSEPVWAATDTVFTASGGTGTAFQTSGTAYSTGLNVVASSFGVAADATRPGGAGGTGVYGVGDIYGVRGEGMAGTGVYGASSGSSVSKGIYGKHMASGYAIYGEAISSGGYGVTGVALDQFGVIGQSDSGTAMQGQVQAVKIGGGANTAANTIAVKGVNQSAGAGGFGVYGSSARSFGGWFESGSDQGVGGVVGVARAAGTVGFQALALSPATTAGFFSGSVSVIGSLGVTGGKFAVVKGADGQYRGMYAVESPECWFEDFGTGTLAGGKADVKLDPLFAQHVRTDSYHVFLTPHDPSHHLAATARTGQGFSVAASASADAAAQGTKAADLTGTFSYRIVAKRNDIKGERMPVWELPTPAFAPEPPAPAPKPAPILASQPSGQAAPSAAPAPVPPGR
jgi:hypothetical protein